MTDAPLLPFFPERDPIHNLEFVVLVDVDYFCHDKYRHLHVLEVKGWRKLDEKEYKSKDDLRTYLEKKTGKYMLELTNFKEDFFHEFFEMDMDDGQKWMLGEDGLLWEHYYESWKENPKALWWLHVVIYEHIFQDNRPYRVLLKDMGQILPEDAMQS